MKRRTWIALLIALAAAAWPLRAATAQPSPVALSSAAPASSTDEGTLRAQLTSLTGLSDLLRRVEQYHPKLVAARIDRDIAQAVVTEKQGAFDPQIDAYSDYMRYNGGGGKPKEATDNTVAVSWLTPDGLKMAAGIDYDRGAVKSPTNPTGSAGEYFFDLKIPLMRGFGVNAKQAAARQALVKTGSAEVYLGLTRLQILLAASASWWDWVAAQRRLQVQRDVLAVASERAALIHKRADAGDLPPIDALEADAEVERRREMVVKAERDVQKAAYKLSLYSWQAEQQPAPLPPEAVASEMPRLVAVADDELGKASLEAVQRRPELRSLKFERDIVRIDLDLAKNDKKPRVDFFVHPGYDAGNGGVGLTMKTGVSVTIPLRTREADGRIQAARLRLQRLDVQQSHDLRTVLVEVEDAANALNNAVERYSVARKALSLAEKLEEGERVRFDLGDGTLFLVNQRERATADARLKLVDLEAEYAVALCTFLAVSAQL